MIWLFPSENGRMPRVTLGIEEASLHRSTGGNASVDLVSSLSDIPSPAENPEGNSLLCELLANLDMEKVALHFSSIDGAYDYAYTLYDTGHFVEAATLYERLFTLSSPCDTDYCLAACSWAKAGNNDMAFKNLYHAVNSGWTTAAYFKEEPALDSVKNTKEWEEFINSCI